MSPRKSKGLDGIDQGHREDELLKMLTSKGRLEYRRVEEDDFCQGQWTFINEFEHLKADKTNRIIILEYRSEYLAAGCL